MPVIYSPPPANHLVKGRVSKRGVPAREPRFIRANEVDHVDARLKVAIRRDILVMSGRSDVVREAKTVVAVAEVHVQQPLVGTIKGDASLCHCHHCVVVTHVGRQNHDTRVEQIRPSNVRSRSKGMRHVEEFIGGTICDYVGVDVDNLGELSLFPEIDLSESRVQVSSVHKVQVGRPVVAYARNWDHVVVDGLHHKSHQHG